MENVKKVFTISLTTLAIGFMAGWVINGWRLNVSHEVEKSAVLVRETERLKKAMENNRSLQETVSELQARMKKENNNAKKKYDDLLARINRGDIRVSIPVREGSGFPAAGRAADADRKTRAELDPKTVERILSVGRDGDDAIRDLNLCIDQYQVITKIKEQ